jgi:hypothetical protein
MRCLKDKKCSFLLKKYFVNNFLIGFYNLSSCFIHYDVKCLENVLPLFLHYNIINYYYYYYNQAAFFMTG